MGELSRDSVAHTLCIPLNGRMIAAEKYPDLFPDPNAGRIVRELGEDMSNGIMYRLQYNVLNCVIRQYNLASEITAYLHGHPNASVVELGAGLSCLRQQMGNTSNTWYCLDTPQVIALRKKYIDPQGNEKEVACDLNNFSWFDKIESDPEQGMVFAAGGLFYYFHYEQVAALLTAMAHRFPGSVVAFDAVNARGLKGVRREVQLGRNSSEAFFSLENPVEEILRWSPDIERVVEKDYYEGYLRSGYRPTLLTRIIRSITRRFHMCFMVHVVFRS